MKTIAIANEKGGVGKTSTCAAIAAGLALKGYRTLLIDLDAQGNLSYITGADRSKPAALEVLTGQTKPADAIQHLKTGDIIAGSKALAGADTFIKETGKEYRLKEALEDLKGLYDFVIIDCPPSLGILTINALTACDSVIVPAQADILSLQGVDQLAETIAPVKKYCNPRLQIEGILLTRYSSRSVLSNEVAQLAEQLAQRLGTRLFKTTIREAIAVKEAQISQRTIQDYAPKAKVTADYSALVDEILRGE